MKLQEEKKKKKKPWDILRKEGGSSQGEEVTAELRLFVGNTSVKCHDVNYSVIEGNMTVCVLPFSKREEDIMDKQ